MARSKNASQRRKVLADLRTVAKRLDWLKNRWTVTTKVYVDQPQREESGNYLRDRLESEYPENRAQDWYALYNQTAFAIQELEELKELALERYRAFTSEGQES